MLANSRNSENCLHVIPAANGIGSRIPALFTSVNKAVIRRRPLESYGLHHASATCCPVSGIDINMFAPQTIRAMIGITVANYLLTAMFAREILYRSFKAHGVLQKASAQRASHCTVTVVLFRILVPENE